MFDLICGSGSAGFLGDASLWSLVGLAVNLLFWLGLFAALVVVAVLVQRNGGVAASTSRQLSGQPSAKEILQTRYASGEISREQYELMRLSIE